MLYNQQLCAYDIKLISMNNLLTEPKAARFMITKKKSLLVKLVGMTPTDKIARICAPQIPTKNKYFRIISLNPISFGIVCNVYV